MDSKIYVIGHKNPDTDSVCSAISYALLKNRLSGGNDYVPMRAGHLNKETEYVLKYFDVEKPSYLDTLEPRIKDVSMRKTKGLKMEDSLKSAWNRMKEENLRTMPVFDGDELVGLITTGDIARSMMEGQAPDTLSASSVSCKNIVDTLDGELIVGDPDAVFSEGEVGVGAADPVTMANNVKEHSLVIMANRADSQIGALELGAEWLIVCLGSKILEVIKKMAAEVGCNIIVTPYSTYKAAALINQAMPVRHIMYKGDAVSFHEMDFVRDVRKVMTKRRIRYYPVFNKQEKFIGLISQRNLLDLEPRQVILVDHNEESQAADGIRSADVVEIIDHHRIDSIQTSKPAYFRCQPLGCTCTIIAQMYKENNVEIDKKTAGIMASAIISDTLCFRSPTCTPLDEQTARELCSIAGIGPEEFARGMFTAGSEIGKRTDEELFYQDFKSFTVDSHNVGAGQMTVVGEKVMEEAESRILEFMKKSIERSHNDVLFFMLTDVLSESSRLIYVTNDRDIDIQELIKTAFGVTPGEYTVTVPGLVSRKKQLIPSITMAIQSMK